MTYLKSRSAHLKFDSANLKHMKIWATDLLGFWCQKNRAGTFICSPCLWTCDWLCLHVGRQEIFTAHSFPSLSFDLLIQSFFCSLSLSFSHSSLLYHSFSLSLLTPSLSISFPMSSIPGLSLSLCPSLHLPLPWLEKWHKTPVIKLRPTQRCSVHSSCCCLICSVGL